MKNKFVFGIMPLMAFAIPVLSQIQWKLDKANSNINFTVSHMVISDVTGKFNDFDAAMKSNPEDFTNASVVVTIKTKSIDTGNEGRDNHLRNADFFNADVDSLITFTSTAFEKIADSRYKVSGTLFMHGISKPVVLDALYKGKISSPQRERIAFKAKTTLHRADWGLTWNRTIESGGLLVGEDVGLDINIEFVTAK